MSKAVETTVIGSYPVSLNTDYMMDAYNQGVLPSWHPYIERAVTAMSNAGINLISDGQTRDSLVDIFIRGFNGCRIRKRAEVYGPIDLGDSITKEDLCFVSSIVQNDRKVLGVITGPYTLSASVVDLFYHDAKELAFAFAEALKKEVLYIEPLVDMISIDEPCFVNNFPEYARELIETIENTVSCPMRLHVCGDVSSIVSDLVDLPVDILAHEFKASPQLFDVFSEYPSERGICLGAVRSDQVEVESVSDICSHIQKGQEVFGSKLKQIAPDCGLRLLSEKQAFLKLRNLVAATEEIYG